MDGLKVDTAVLRELLIQRVPAVNKRLEDFGGWIFFFLNGKHLQYKYTLNPF